MYGAHTGNNYPCIRRRLSAFSLRNRRMRFYDLSAIPHDRRKPRSSIIQFYSAANNIGNYLPVLGIRDMIDYSTDTWNIHDNAIDFDFINANYRFAIVGGAGLLHGAFELFWQKLSRECRLPFIIWGIGACFPASQDIPPVSIESARQAFERAELVNLRDDWTAEYYGLKNVHIAPCPTIEYLTRFDKEERVAKHILISTHSGLITRNEEVSILRVVSSMKNRVVETDNKQTRRNDIPAIIRKCYIHARFVVTTRLHGAIIAYGLGIPYIAITRDHKLDAFHRLYGNGLLTADIEEMSRSLPHVGNQPLNSIRIDDVREFGYLAKDRIEQYL